MSEETQSGELLERINQFLYAEEQIDETTLNADMERVAGETGLTVEQVTAVTESVLAIMEERKEERGIKSGEALPAYIVRRHAQRRRHWGGF